MRIFFQEKLEGEVAEILLLRVTDVSNYLIFFGDKDFNQWSDFD